MRGPGGENQGAIIGSEHDEMNEGGEKKIDGLELARGISKCGRSVVAMMMTEGFAAQPWNNEGRHGQEDEKGSNSTR